MFVWPKLTIYAPMIYTAPCIMFRMRAYQLRGEVGGGWALEFSSFLGPVKWHRADRRVPFSAYDTDKYSESRLWWTNKNVHFGRFSASSEGWTDTPPYRKISRNMNRSLVKSEIRKKQVCRMHVIYLSQMFRMNARGFCYHKKNAWIMKDLTRQRYIYTEIQPTYLQHCRTVIS